MYFFFFRYFWCIAYLSFCRSRWLWRSGSGKSNTAHSSLHVANSFVPAGNTWQKQVLVVPWYWSPWKKQALFSASDGSPEKKNNHWWKVGIENRLLSSQKYDPCFSTQVSNSRPWGHMWPTSQTANDVFISCLSIKSLFKKLQIVSYSVFTPLFKTHWNIVELALIYTVWSLLSINLFAKCNHTMKKLLYCIQLRYMVSQSLRSFEGNYNYNVAHEKNKFDTHNNIIIQCRRVLGIVQNMNKSSSNLEK